MLIDLFDLVQTNNVLEEACDKIIKYLTESLGAG